MSIYVTPNRLPLFVGESRDQRWSNTAQPVVAGIAFVQAKSANSATAEVASLDVVLDTPATAGHLIVVAANSDATITGFSGSSTADSAVNAQGCYLFYKIAAGGETTLTVTPSVSRPMAAVAAVYSGITASSPVDQTVTATNTGAPTVSASPGTTGVTSQAAELVIAVMGPHSFNDDAAPTAPAWTGGYTTRGSTAATFTTGARNSAVFLGELIVSSTGTQTTTTTWTNSSQDWGGIIATFKGA